MTESAEPTPYVQSDWFQAEVEMPAHGWRDASGEIPGSRFITALGFGPVPLHVYAHQVTRSEEGGWVDGFTEYPEDFDRIQGLDEEANFMVVPLTGVAGASGEYLIYAYPFAN